VTVGERFIRGFRRVGIVAAVPCLVAAVIIAGYGAVSEYQRTHGDDWWKNAPLAKSEPSRAITFDDLIPRKPGQPAQPAKGPWDDYGQKEPQLVPVDHDPFAKSELVPALQLAGNCDCQRCPAKYCGSNAYVVCAWSRFGKRTRRRSGEGPSLYANFTVETGHFPWWPLIEIRRPCNSSSQTCSTVPALPLVRITALPTSSVWASSNAPRIGDARTFAASEGSKSSGGSKWSVSLIRNKRRSDCNVPPFVGKSLNLALATVRISSRLRTVRHRGSSIQ
jgi:hypothetical protein